MRAPAILFLALPIASLLPLEVIHCAPAIIITTTATMLAMVRRYLYIKVINSPTLENSDLPPKEISVLLVPAGRHRPHGSLGSPPVQGATEASDTNPLLSSLVPNCFLNFSQSLFLQQKGFVSGILLVLSTWALAGKDIKRINSTADMIVIFFNINLKLFNKLFPRLPRHYPFYFLPVYKKRRRAAYPKPIAVSIISIYFYCRNAG